jgi:radical SAM superfamily enzyme YgiQ (UPF0313 family)
MLKIAFINPPHADWCSVNIAAWLYVKSFYDRHGKYANQVEWIEPSYRWSKYTSIKEIIDETKEADIILFSSYVWNHNIVDKIAREVKKISPDVITVLGGPHIGQYNAEYLKSRDCYDYICRPTKPGEVFVQDLIDEWFENNKKPNIDNIAWELRSYKKRDCPMPDYSMYRDHLPFIKKLADYAKENELEKFIIIETTRGCPYSCVFCEWGGGIGGKVIKKDIEIVKQDIDAIVEAGYTSAFLSDANFGIYEERDIEIFRYAFENGLLLTDISTVKAKDLKRRIRLVDAWFNIVGARKAQTEQTEKRNKVSYLERDYYSSIPTLSFQSTSEEAMKVAKRADLSYKDKVTLSEHINKRCKEFNFPIPACELILAMPGSTLDDFYNDFELLWNIKSFGLPRHDYMMLPDSELSDPVYIEKYKIKTVEVYTDIMDFDDIDNLQSNEIWESRKQNRFYTVSSCYSYTTEELCQMAFMNIANNYLLKEIYSMYEDMFSPAQFGKHCFSIIKELDGFDKIYNEIRDLYNPNTPMKNIRRINGEVRADVVEDFLKTNYKIIISELFTK